MCARCPCPTQNGYLCGACEQSPDAPITSDTMRCHACDGPVCLEHTDRRAVDGGVCGSCLSTAEFGSSEEDWGLDSDDPDHSYAGEDSQHPFGHQPADYDTSPRFFSSEGTRMMPWWMTAVERDAETRHFIPRYADIDPGRSRPVWPPPEVTLKQIDVRTRDVCAVCISSFQDGETGAHLSCHATHVFHEACIRPWWERMSSCPLCRQN